MVNPLPPQVNHSNTLLSFLWKTFSMISSILHLLQSLWVTMGLWTSPLPLEGAALLSGAWNLHGMNVWSFQTLRADGVWEHSYNWGNKCTHSFIILVYKNMDLRDSAANLASSRKVFHCWLCPNGNTHQLQPHRTHYEIKSYELSCRTKTPLV